MKKQTATQSKGQLIKSKREFGLESSPDAYVISIHVRNMMATYGEEYVRSILKELFLTEQKPKGQPSKGAVGT